MCFSLFIEKNSLNIIFLDNLFHILSLLPIIYALDYNESMHMSDVNVTDLDRTDIELLRLLQNDGSLTLAQLAEAVNLSTTPCWKRLKRLKHTGILKGVVALLDPAKVGLSFTAFVQIKTKNHSECWYQQFVDKVSAFDEVMELFRMAGDYDYMMKIQVADMKHFDAFYKSIARINDITKVTSSFAMELLKYSTALPI